MLGLLIGFTVPVLVNPRMGLSSHLEGVMNGIFLVLLGLIWPKLNIGPMSQVVAFWLAIYGTFANWLATLLSAYWGAGAAMTIASAGFQGADWQEGIITFLLFSLSFAMIALCSLVIWGLRVVGHGSGFNDKR